MEMWKRAVLVGLCVLVALGSAGCKTVARKAVEQATGVKVEDDGGSVTVKTDEGEATIEGGAKLPEGFPESVPVYKGTIESGSSMTSGEAKTFAVVVLTEDAPETVKEYYLEELPAKGWEVGMTLDTGTSASRGVMISAEREDLTVTVTIEERTGEGTQVSLLVGTKS
ncbi:hypothetical protein MX659_05105 [Coriobacteriia bacterium Es71-Z0120]|uniref:hypothetical protein n=1 Tax=Parvivirga hydrogeniphila TaxID=2939460 RepID=UPI002260E967|nr:hypothetical protein [Parvivirga hydrogeniphila]MCL4078970.1 hypothetical protein [Parvivirga hydrogeniphila]